MEREARHPATAVDDIKNAIQRNDQRLLASGVMNSRNWTLSVVMSHCYIQTLPGGNAPGSSGFAGQATPLPTIQLDLLFPRAVKAGVEDGARDRRA